MPGNSVWAIFGEGARNMGMDFLGEVFCWGVWLYQFYMIKFILERYANANNEEQEDPEPKNKNTEIVATNASTVALKNLKLTEDHLDALKRRLSVLSIRDQKYQNKAKSNERKMEFHAKVQDSMARDRKRKMKYLQHFQNELQLSKQRIQCFKNQRKENLKQSREGLFQLKRHQCESIKKQSQSNQKSIEKMKIEEITENNNKKKAINQMEKLQKQHIVQYFFNKKNNFRESSAREGSQFQSRRSSRSRLIQELTARESQMIERQSSSRAALEESTRRLYKISTSLKPIKREKSTSDFSEKLPPVNQSHQQLVFL